MTCCPVATWQSMVERVPFDGGFLLYLVAHIVHIQVT
jgi:hypothetical protein